MPVELFAFTCGTFQAPLSFFIGGEDRSFLKAPIPAYLIRHPEKGLAVFDTGLGLRFRQEFEVQLPPDQVGFNFRESDELAARMRVAGFDPDAVNWVINSHLHPDHCGGNAAFANATIVLQRREKDAAFSAEGDRNYTKADFDTGQPILAVDGEHDLFGDRSVVLEPTFGHSPGHQSARVRTANGEVMLTADCCYLARSLDTLGVPATNFDQEASLEVLKRLKAIRDNGTRLFYGHDPEQWRGVPQGVRLG